MSIEDDQMGDEQMDDEQVMAALVDLHRGLDRQGPGDEAFSRDILARLPQIPVTSTVADLGCGSGAASVLLARHLARPVVCVDTSAEFLEGLTARAEAAGVPHLTTALCATWAPSTRGSTGST